MRTHAHHICVCDTRAGLGQIVLADIFQDLFEETLRLTGEVGLCGTAISKKGTKGV